MKKGTILKHYLPCLYFISLTLCIAYITYNNAGQPETHVRNNFILCAAVLTVFTALLFVRRSYARMAAGLVTLFLSLYASLAWFDEMVDVGHAGGVPSAMLRNSIYYIAGAFCMSILLIIPLHMPAKTPLYNRK